MHLKSPLFSSLCYHLLIKLLQSISRFRSAKLHPSEFFWDNNLSMLCHFELLSASCLNMDDRNQVSEFSYLEFDVMLTFAAACPFESRPEKTMTVRQLRAEFREARKHFLNKQSSHLDFSAWGTKPRKPTVLEPCFPHLHIFILYVSQSKSQQRETVINDTRRHLEKVTEAEWTSLGSGCSEKVLIY